MAQVKKEIHLKQYKDAVVQNQIRDLYKMVLGYTMMNQGNKGYINTQAVDGKDDIFADVLQLGQNGSNGATRIEKYVYGLKVGEDGNLYIATEYVEQETEQKVVWTEEDFQDEKNWVKFTDPNNNIVAFTTLLCICDVLEQYSSIESH